MLISSEAVLDDACCWSGMLAFVVEYVCGSVASEMNLFAHAVFNLD